MARKPARLARKIVLVYFTVALFVFAPYFTWQSAHGGRPGLRMRFLVPTAKALAWPIFACTELRARQVDAAAAAYFAEVHYVRDGHKRCSAMVADARKLADERVEIEDDESARRTLASCFGDVAEQYRADAVGLQRIKPPAYLKELHSSLVEDTALLADTADRMQQAAEVNETEQFDELDAEISTVESRMNASIKSTAEKYGVTP